MNDRFNEFACIGDSITRDHDGLTYTARLEYDDSSTPDDYECYSLEEKVSWLKDEWLYCGIIVSVSRNGAVLEDHVTSCWGFELNFSDDSYLTEEAENLIPIAHINAPRILNELGLALV